MTSVTSVHRTAVEEAKQGLRRYQESIQCAISRRETQKHRPPMSAQDRQRLENNLDAITGLIVALNTGYKLEDPWTQGSLSHIPKGYSMAIERYKTYAQCISEVQAEAQDLVEEFTGRPVQQDVQCR